MFLESRISTSITKIKKYWRHAQGLVNVPVWEYWTSPYSSHYRPLIPNGWVMWKMGTWLMTHGITSRKSPTRKSSPAHSAWEAGQTWCCNWQWSPCRCRQAPVPGARAKKNTRIPRICPANMLDLKHAHGDWRNCQWIGLRENLQETIDFPIKYGAFL